MVNFHLRKWPPIVAMESDVTPTNPMGGNIWLYEEMSYYS